MLRCDVTANSSWATTSPTAGQWLNYSGPDAYIALSDSRLSFVREFVGGMNMAPAN